MADIFRTRESLKKVYPNKSWAAKVDAMSDQKVLAIFFRLRREGRV